MKNHDARVGDIVQLAAGGPEMRVFAYDSGGNLHCEWKGNEGREEGTFDPAVLTMVAQRDEASAPADDDLSNEGAAQALPEQ